MNIAFYKDNTKLFNRFISWWTNGPYSHCEAMVSENKWASSSVEDGGVRFKTMVLNPAKWDVIDVPGVDLEEIKSWFNSHLGDSYDLLGLLSIFSPVSEDKNKEFCSEAIAAAMGIRDPWRFDPNRLAIVCEQLGGKWL